mgnify:CR=1 FL=1
MLTGIGHERDEVCAFINIDIEAVGNWAERRGLAYAGYTDLAAKDEVYGLIQECVELGQLLAEHLRRVRHALAARAARGAALPR